MPHTPPTSHAGATHPCLPPTPGGSRAAACPPCCAPPWAQLAPPPDPPRHPRIRHALAAVLPGHRAASLSRRRSPWSCLFPPTHQHAHNTQHPQQQQQNPSPPAGAPDAAADSLLANLFAGVSAVKAAYAQLQMAQFPYDAEVIQSADAAVVAELTRLSDTKRRFLKDPAGAARDAAAAGNTALSAPRPSDLACSNGPSYCLAHVVKVLNTGSFVVRASQLIDDHVNSYAFVVSMLTFIPYERIWRSLRYEASVRRDSSIVKVIAGVQIIAAKSTSRLRAPPRRKMAGGSDVLLSGRLSAFGLNDFQTGAIRSCVSAVQCGGADSKISLIWGTPGNGSVQIEAGTATNCRRARPTPSLHGIVPTPNQTSFPPPRI